MNPASILLHDSRERRFETHLEGWVSFVSYRLDGNRCTLEHTFVPDALRGRGMAAALVAAALDEARRRGWTIVPACSYVAAFLRRRPEYADLLDPEWQATDRG